MKHRGIGTAMASETITNILTAKGHVRVISDSVLLSTIFLVLMWNDPDSKH